MSCHWFARCRAWRSLSPRSAAIWSATGCARQWTYGCKSRVEAMRTGLPLDPRDRGGLQQPMLIARDLRKHFPVKGSGKSVQAVDGVSFTVGKGETLGIVGESGCGKSTLARLLLHLVTPDRGELVFDGDLVNTRELPVDALRRQVQIVLQDSYSSLNPRMPVRDSVAFGPFVQGRKKRQARAIACEMLGKVGL